jgi:1-aminocyclopropane-1-carboxylate deaminase/D-cysteine desulfhydrase-like pyridoxal-dependent ACC family enzyme
MDIERDPATLLPRLRLAHLPTPCTAAPRLAARLGLASLRVKREDLSGAAFGGNKLRQIDFFLAAARAEGADTLVTTAASQSNFCRALAGACAEAGLSCHLMLRRAGGTALQGNLLLDQIFGATLHWTDQTDPWAPAVRDELQAILDGLRAAGHRPHLIQLPGESAALAVAGWVSGAAELHEQLGAELADSLVLACGSGLTCAGLALGLKLAGRRTRVVGISVQQPASRLRPWIVETAARASALLGSSVRLDAADFDLLDGHIGPGYGKPSPASIEAVRLAGATAGLVLDPVYTGKAFAALVALAGEGRLGRHVVFLHSGGAPGLFVHADAFGADAFQP